MMATVTASSSGAGQTGSRVASSGQWPATQPRGKVIHPRVVHAAFLQDVCPPPRADRLPDSKLGFEIGWDYARHGVSVPASLLDCKSFFEGYNAGREHWYTTVNHDRFVKKWLHLRVSAWRRCRAIAGDVTPQYLRLIDVPRCPVTRELLTHDTLTDTDASIDRLNNDMGYSQSNLVVMSARANKAKGALSATEILHLARELELQGPGAKLMKLDVVQWIRLATLTAFSEGFADPKVANAWPLVILPPPGAAITGWGFVIKVTVSTLAYFYPGYGPLRPALRGKAVKEQYEHFRTSLNHAARSARRGLANLLAREADMCALEDAWLSPLVNQQWKKLLPHLQEIGFEHINACGAGLMERVDVAKILRSGCADSRGYVQ